MGKNRAWLSTAGAIRKDSPLQRGVFPVMSTYLVAGVSGHTGSVVAQSLLDQKQKVRVLVRDAAKGERWKKRGAEVVVASLEDAHAMGAALRGADAAYLLVPPPPHDASGVLARSKRIVDTFV